MKVGTAERPRRNYRQVARAEAKTANRKRILEAAVAGFWDAPTGRLSLDDVARRAGVSTQTVIRHFGGSDGLFAAAAQREGERIRRQRDQATPGDARAAVGVLVDHYEELGDRVVAMLADEHRAEHLRGITEAGRELHRKWCTRAFAPALDGLEGAVRKRRLAQIVAVCDVFTWKLLRRDSGLSRRQTELAILELLEPILKET